MSLTAVDLKRKGLIYAPHAHQLSLTDMLITVLTVRNHFTAPWMNYVQNAVVNQENMLILLRQKGPATLAPSVWNNACIT